VSGDSTGCRAAPMSVTATAHDLGGVDQAADLAAAVAELLDLLTPPAWHRWAACKGSGLNFFTRRGESVQPLKAVCASCPVTSQCLEAAATEKFGLWGGQSERQRRLVRRDARLDATETA
jgi:WhiB family redox-sensing transcriptional regulator